MRRLLTACLLCLLLASCASALPGSRKLGEGFQLYCQSLDDLNPAAFAFLPAGGSGPIGRWQGGPPCLTLPRAHGIDKFSGGRA